MAGNATPNPSRAQKTHNLVAFLIIAAWAATFLVPRTTTRTVLLTKSRCPLLEQLRAQRVGARWLAPQAANRHRPLANGRFHERGRSLCKKAPQAAGSKKVTLQKRHRPLVNCVNALAHRWKQVKWTNTFTTRELRTTGSQQASLVENRISRSSMLLVVVAWFPMDLVAEIPMLVCMEHPHKKILRA